MEFCLLGPLVVRSEGVVVPVPAGKQRAVLAALLLDAGRVVGLDELAEVLWGAGPPRSARVTLQNHVMRLRQALGEASRHRIATEPGGYRIRVGAGELDVSRFEALLADAQAAARDGFWEASAGRARAALALWRGEPLADTGSEVLAEREVPRLAELRLQALEARIEADLHLGHHAGVIGELRQLAGLHPLREHLHGLLMLALYRDGRTGESLAAYRQARAVLVEELGIEPGAGLRELQQQILTADATLGAPGPAWPAADSGLAVPRQLPGTVRHFTGRSGELAALTELLDRATGPAPQPVVISAIGGTAGVGKTALAVHWANQVADRFPDGQLYVNLRGYDPARPMPTADALAGFLRALGVPGQDIPAETGERAAQYRSLLAGRRMLVLLDNAGSVEQVRPLLPGSPACAAVVTSRDSLAGLVARDGAARLDLDLLPATEAAALLRALIGARAVTDPAATAALAAQCARLPLALRVAAELAAARPGAPLADLVSELADRQRRLDLLDAGGDRQTAVRAVFSWSYRRLDPDAARVFRLAGLHPGPDLDRYAAAALADSTLEQASQVLDLLARAHLIQPAGSGRHGLHDLLRDYARQLSAAEDGPDGQRAALTRLLDYYLHTAAAAMDALVPAERHRRPRIARPGSPAPPVADPAAARAWLDTQRAGLVAAAVHAADCGWPGHATRLSATLFRYLDTGGYYPEAIVIHACARRAARRAGDKGAEAAALNSLGLVASRQGRYQQATSHLTQALALFKETGDIAGQARALGGLGSWGWRQGRYRQATGHLRQALELYRQVGDRNGEARTLGNLGVIEQRVGQYQQATSHLTQALALCRETGDRTGQAAALVNLGIADQRQGKHEQATSHLTQALALFRETGDRAGEAGSLNSLGQVSLATGQLGHARSQHVSALDLASQIGDKYEQARAHHGLGCACHAADDASQARRHWQKALALYTRLNAPEADDVRAQLAAAGTQGAREP